MHCISGIDEWKSMSGWMARSSDAATELVSYLPLALATGLQWVSYRAGQQWACPALRTLCLFQRSLPKHILRVTASLATARCHLPVKHTTTKPFRVLHSRQPAGR